MSVPTLSYDSKGNLTGIGSNSYSYSSENLLKTGPGSIVAVTNGSGTLTATNRYDEYGNPASTNAAVSAGGRFGYTGQMWLPEVGLFYYKARMYSPVPGRFMQADPIGFSGGMNVYNYVGSDPMNDKDATGLAAGCEAVTGSYILDCSGRDKAKSYLSSHAISGGDSTGRSALNAIADYITGGGSLQSVANAPGYNGIVVEARRPWTNIDFFKHYLDGTGTTVNLKDIGLDEVFENSSSVKHAIAIIDAELEKKRAGRDGVYKSKAVIDLTNKILVLGNGILFGEISCQFGLCGTHYYLRDWFKDPLDYFDLIPGEVELPGSKIYRINHDF